MACLAALITRAVVRVSIYLVMVRSLTRHSTTRRDDMNSFNFDLEGFSKFSLQGLFRGTAIESLAIPVGHSLTAAWLVLLSLSNGMLIEVSSLCNDLGDWREVGSLKLRLITGTVHDAPHVDWIFHNFVDFNIVLIEKIVYSETDFQTECGICLVSAKGEEICVVAAPAPGSVSVKFPGSPDEFVTEIPIDECIRIQQVVE